MFNNIDSVINNFHNVFINIFIDLGVIGLLVYFLILKMIFVSFISKKNRMIMFYLMFLPLFICMNFQYLGFDNDIIVFFLSVYLINLLSENNKKYILDE